MKDLRDLSFIRGEKNKRECNSDGCVSTTDKFRMGKKEGG